MLIRPTFCMFQATFSLGGHLIYPYVFSLFPVSLKPRFLLWPLWGWVFLDCKDLIIWQDSEADAARHKDHEENGRDELFGILNALKVKKLLCFRFVILLFRHIY